MNRRRLNGLVWLVLLSAGALLGACRKTYTYAVVPRPNGGYRPDTLRAIQNGNQVLVIFRFDTVTRTRTIYRTDTLWREGARIIRDTVRLVRRDTIRLMRVDTVRVSSVGAMRVANRDTVVVTRTVVRVDTVRIPRADTVLMSRTVPARVDTVFISGATRVRRDTVRIVRVDTVQVGRRDTVRLVRVDTVRSVGRVDTVRVARVDTVRIIRVDTVRVASNSSNTSSKRTLRLPPGHYPPEGQCRVWIEGRPPGQQANAAPCDALGTIPAGAFILFGGEAWDFDYDWLANPTGAPSQIIALKRKR
jgi:hypothetical protein